MSDKVKGAIIGFKGVHLAPILEDSDTKYETGEAIHLPYAGEMTRSEKTTSGEAHYDDEEYAKVDETLGEEVEMKFGEMTYDTLVALKIGKMKGDVFNAPLTIKPKAYSLRCETNTVSGFPEYFNWRKFMLTGVRVGDFKTKSTGIQVAEVIVKGTIGKVKCPLTDDYARTKLKPDLSNNTACQDFLKKAEVIE